MTPDREDDGLLDRLIRQILEQPFPENPPAEVRRRMVALGQLGPQPGRPNSFFAWLRTAVAAASLLLVTRSVLATVCQLGEAGRRSGRPIPKPGS